ncbi:unnamed protein product [Echinostoma caproni]|uniref:3',5'-cyclic-AMP phosphodiesterase n=1 Tax=Echinostoma caproni TaxID=27848 RepID=A0A183AD81_9TREM|nr:unnamed protein product [Echinostoma caproni]
MWTSCCFVNKRRSGRVKTSIQSINITKHGAHPTGKSSSNELSEKPLIDATANGYQLSHERRSLPDVVITSASMAPTKALPMTRPSLQLDRETGRRPTLDVETTARLAEAESIGFEDLAGTDAPGTKTSYRSKSLGSTQLTKQMGGMYKPIAQSRASTSNATQTDDVLCMDKVSKKANLMRLATLKGFQKHLRKLSTLRHSHTPDAGSKVDAELRQNTSSRASKDSRIVEENDDSSEQASVGDCLGQLPPKSLTRGNRFIRYSVSEGSHKSAVVNESSNYTAAAPRPGGIRRGSLCIFSQVDEPIVTPFAQILASLRRVRANFILLTNVSSLRE